MVVKGGSTIKTDNKEHVLALERNGIILSSDVTNAGIHRSILSSMVDEGIIVKCSRGIYMIADELEDEYYLLQRKYKRGIFSHSTALYLHGYSDRVPLVFHMTFPAGYNSYSLEKENVEITRVSKANYELGIVNVMTPYGNDVAVYDLERCLCDILRGQGDDIQTIQSAFKKYSVSREKDINKLVNYARQLRVEPKVRMYMEVLL